MKKRIKYIIGILVFGLVLYNSVSLQPLDEKRAEGAEKVFDARSLVCKFWETGLPKAYRESYELYSLLYALKNDLEATFQKKSRALGIGNTAYFKEKGKGLVFSINEKNVIIYIGNQPIEIETKFVFGNAVSDACGLSQINDFDETYHFNDISEVINEKIRKVVVPNFKSQVKTGDKIVVYETLELNKEHLNLDHQELIPLILENGS